MNPAVDSMMAAMGLNRCTCKVCKFACPSVAYPQLRCTLVGDYVAPTFACGNFKGSKAQ